MASEDLPSLNMADAAIVDILDPDGECVCVWDVVGLPGRRDRPGGSAERVRVPEVGGALLRPDVRLLLDAGHGLVSGGICLL